MKRLNNLFVVLLLTGCSSISVIERDSATLTQSAVTKKEVQQNKENKQVIIKKVFVEKPVYITKTKIVEKEVEPADQESFQKEITDFSLKYYPKHFKFWVNYFTKEGPNKRRFHRHQRNGEKFRAIVEQVLKEHGLPAELFYVGLIESGFNTKIKSHANAVGPWQFIKGTAKRYGLKVNKSLDERRSIYKSTAAAAMYFKDLYNIFGSWELALCAYNKGEYGIIRAIRKGNTRDYRELVRKKLLPRETVYYIPKVAAAMEVVNNRHKYGFGEYKTEQQQGKLYLRAEKRKLYKTFNVSRIAKSFNVTKKALFQINPDLKQNQIWVSSKRPFELYLPQHSDVQLAEEIAPKRTIDYSKTKVVSSTPTKKHKKYRVRPGDSLIAIAKRFNIPVSELIAVNKIRRHKKNKIYVGQKIKIPTKGLKKVYHVRKGDSLFRISKRFGISINKLVSTNSLKTRKIFVGQKLYIPKM